MNLKFEKWKRVTMVGKCRGEIGSEIGNVAGMVAYVPTMDVDAPGKKCMEHLMDEQW